MKKLLIIAAVLTALCLCVAGNPANPLQKKPATQEMCTTTVVIRLPNGTVVILYI